MGTVLVSVNHRLGSFFPLFQLLWVLKCSLVREAHTGKQKVRSRWLKIHREMSQDAALEHSWSPTLDVLLPFSSEILQFNTWCCIWNLSSTGKKKKKSAIFNDFQRLRQWQFLCPGDVRLVSEVGAYPTLAESDVPPPLPHRAETTATHAAQSLLIAVSLHLSHRDMTGKCMRVCVCARAEDVVISKSGPVFFRHIELSQ